MSEVTIDQLQAELNQAHSQLKGLNAHVQAHSQELDDRKAACINLRTNLILFQQAHKEAVDLNVKLTQENEVLKKDSDMQKAQLAVLSAQIIKLQADAAANEPKPVVTECAAQEPPILE